MITILRSGFALVFSALLICGLTHGQQSVPGAPEGEAAPHSLTALLEGKGFVQVQPGEFLMGSQDGNADEQPVHRVRISYSFEMSKFEVTQAQWDAVMRNPHAASSEKPLDVNPSHFKGVSRPVESINYPAVQQFLARLNARDGKYTYRLPTEAEWEYAAKAGSAEGSPDKREAGAWCESESKGETQPVGQKAANAWGLHDMLGNVSEWVQDWYGPYAGGSDPATDPQGATTSSYKIYRGGAWLSAAKQCRASYRGFDFPASAVYSVGFRLVRTKK